MATLLREGGHEVEVFVISTKDGASVFDQGVRVQRVPVRVSTLDRLILAVARRLTWRMWPVVQDVIYAWRLARALERRHRTHPFEVVQSSNYGLTGLFVSRRALRTHIVRVSTSRVLYDEIDGRVRWASRLIELLDVKTMRRADASYAPSDFLAAYFRNTYGVPVKVLRPPYALGTSPARALEFSVPDRFFIHFGDLSKRKGTDVVAEALALAWQEQPDLKMVWVGNDVQRILEKSGDRWRASGNQAIWLGPLPREQLYRLIELADVAVLPSRIDNLPNTVLESLALGTPVIGSRGASIEEMVEPGRNGDLVPLGDAHALANAMLRAWRNEAPWVGKGFRSPEIFTTMTPQNALEGFLNLSHARGNVGKR